MKYLIYTLLFICSTVSLCAQSLSGPESVTWDAATNRYFVSNNGANQILARSSAGVYTIFTSNISSGPHGLEIVGNILYACDGASVKGFDLTSAALVFNLNLGASFLNGICTDGSNNLFVTDFTARKVLRVNIAQQTFTTFVPVQPKSPNGIYYDQAGARIVWVTWGSNAPIMQALLADSSVSQVTATTLGNCDGLVRDGSGSYYVSAWSQSAIYRFNSSFGSPISVVSGLNSSADIYYNTVTDTLVSPNSGSNTVTFHYFGTTTIAPSVSFSGNVNVFPVPATDRTTIEFETDLAGEIIFSVYDITGRKVMTEQKKYFLAGKNTFAVETSSLETGTYFVRMEAGQTLRTKKISVSRK